MDTANLVASWTSAVVTAVGLGSVAMQVITIKDQLDPFNSARGEDHLVFWGKNKPPRRWFKLANQLPLGPIIDADLNKCQGLDRLHLSRKPLSKVGIASWTVLPAVFHPNRIEPHYQALSEHDIADKKAPSAVAEAEKVHTSSGTPSLPPKQSFPGGAPWH